ncbi:MAG: GTPase [Solirubrobacteraceae bacterium]
MTEPYKAVSQWCDQVLLGIRELAGPAVADDARAAWSEHAGREAVEVTLIGPVSSGKSSLLRRLLAESEIESPPWLTISARRETFELNEVVAGPISFTDVPGFASRSELHDRLAEDALTLSDAFLLVVPPNLLTSRIDLVADVMAGTYYFGRPGGSVPAATIAAIGQSDTLGPDPADDVDGMRELTARKAIELTQQLEGAGAGDMASLKVVAVAANPYEEQPREAQWERESFKEFAAWDGVHELHHELLALADRRDELRAAARTRFMARVGLRVLDQGQQAVDRAGSTAAELRARLSESELQRDRASALVRSAKADLESRLVNSGTELAEQLTDDETAGAAIEQRVNRIVDDWASLWEGRADALVGDTETNVVERLHRPASQETLRYVRSLADTASTAQEQADHTNSHVVNLLNRINGDVDEIARKALEANMHASLAEVITGLSKVAHPKTGGRAFKAAEVATHLTAGIEVVGGVLGIVTTIDAEVRQGRLDEALRQRREEARDRLDIAAKTLAEAIVEGDDGGSGVGWRQWLDARLDAQLSALGLPDDPSGIDRMVKDAERSRVSLGAFETLLEECPE